MIRLISGDGTNMPRCQEAVDTRFRIGEDRLDGRRHSEQGGKQVEIFQLPPYGLLQSHHVYGSGRFKTDREEYDFLVRMAGCQTDGIQR